jgi:hypothetical protein
MLAFKFYYFGSGCYYATADNPPAFGLIVGLILFYFYKAGA